METLVEERERVAAEPPAVFRPLVMVSVAVLAVVRGQLCALLEPTSPLDPGVHSLPRRCPGTRQSLDAAAEAELSRLSGTSGYFEQLYTWSEVSHRSDDRLLEVSYLAPYVAPRSTAQAVEATSVEERSAFSGLSWWPLEQLPRLEPGQTEILGYAHRRLSRKLSYSNIAVHLLPAEFALSDLQSVYEVIRGKPLDKRNFRKWIFATGFVEATPHERRFGAHRPARLYRFTSRELMRLD